jgi:hypothetical protein
VDVAVLDNHVARIDADAELDALVFRDSGVARRHALLHGERAGDRFDNAGKLCEDSVAGGLDDAALVLGDLRVDQLAAEGLEAREGAGLVLAHEPAVSRNIGREDGREPALDPLSAQMSLPAALGQCAPGRCSGQQASGLDAERLDSIRGDRPKWLQI